MRLLRWSPFDYIKGGVPPADWVSTDSKASGPSPARPKVVRALRKRGTQSEVYAPAPQWYTAEDEEDDCDCLLGNLLWTSVPVVDLDMPPSGQFSAIRSLCSAATQTDPKVELLPHHRAEQTPPLKPQDHRQAQDKAELRHSETQAQRLLDTEVAVRRLEQRREGLRWREREADGVGHWQWTTTWQRAALEGEWQAGREELLWQEAECRAHIEDAAQHSESEVYRVHRHNMRQSISQPDRNFEACHEAHRLMRSLLVSSESAARWQMRADEEGGWTEVVSVSQRIVAAQHDWEVACATFWAEETSRRHHLHSQEGQGTLRLLREHRKALHQMASQMSETNTTVETALRVLIGAEAKGRVAVVFAEALQWREAGEGCVHEVEHFVEELRHRQRRAQRWTAILGDLWTGLEAREAQSRASVTEAEQTDRLRLLTEGRVAMAHLWEVRTAVKTATAVKALEAFEAQGRGAIAEAEQTDRLEKLSEERVHRWKVGTVEKCRKGMEALKEMEERRRPAVIAMEGRGRRQLERSVGLQTAECATRMALIGAEAAERQPVAALLFAERLQFALGHDAPRRLSKEEDESEAPSESTCSSSEDARSMICQAPRFSFQPPKS